VDSGTTVIPCTAFSKKIWVVIGTKASTYCTTVCLYHIFATFSLC